MTQRYPGEAAARRVPAQGALPVATFGRTCAYSNKEEADNRACMALDPIAWGWASSDRCSGHAAS